MNPVEMALQTWRDEKLRYHKQINQVIADLSKSPKLIPSPEFQTKQEELKQYLKYNYNDEDDQEFYQVYVHHIAGVINVSLMELSNKLVQNLGGSVNFWQNKIIDIATYVNYHPELSIWEINRFYQNYMGLPPQLTNNLRKKRSLAKNYLFWLTSICKTIDKCKPNQQQLLKIDQSYKKLKKSEQKYYAFMEQIEEISHNQPAISTKGKNNAKNTLFMFLKKKDDKVNTLINYNFKVTKQENQQQSKLLKGKEYEEFDEIFNRLMKSTRSQRASNYSDTSQSMFPASNSKSTSIPIHQLKTELKKSFKNEKKQKDLQRSTQNTFIWSKQYFFTYWGYPVKPIPEMDFTLPFKAYPEIIYDIDSEEEFDQLNAEDLNHLDQLSDEQSDSDAGSFVVGDDYKSDEEQDKDSLRVNQKIYQKQSWRKNGDQLQQLQMICLFPEESHPLCMEQDMLNFDDEFIQKLSGKGRYEIFSIFEAEKKDISKRRIDSLLKNNFKKMRNKSKQVIYVRNDQPGNLEKPIEILSDPETTTGQPIQISISYATRTRRSRGKGRDNDTILQQSPFQSK